MRMPIFLLLAAIMAASPALARQHQHESTPANEAQAAPAQPFATDAQLRKEMQGVRQAIDALGHYEHGHMGPEQAVILATNIEGHVNTIIAKCKLPPDADAALHKIIVPLLQNAGALKKNPRDLSPIAPMRDALTNYDRQFQEPEPE